MGETKKKSKKQDEGPELKELLQRTQANFENYRKQSEKRIEDIRKMASKNVIVELLPIVDNFELALKNAPENKFMDGIKLIHDQIHKVLVEHGVELIEEMIEFNPHFHEALMKVASDQPENTILEVLQRGYKMHDVVLRPARVKLSAGKKSEEAQSDTLMLNKEESESTDTTVPIEDNEATKNTNGGQ
jgi:molecular chaperone GrpE (heat shock protein)